MGGRRRQRAGAPRSRSPSSPGCTAPSPTRGRACATSVFLTTGSRWKLTGRLATDRGDASGTGYWSPIEEAYRWDLLEIVGSDLDWSAIVPPVLGPSDAAGEWDEAVGKPRVACGTGDNMAAALGTGLGIGEISMSLGHVGHRVRRERSRDRDATGAVAGFADATGRYLPLVCTLNATKVTDAIARLLGHRRRPTRRARTGRLRRSRRNHRPAVVRR